MHTRTHSLFRLKHVLFAPTALISLAAIMAAGCGGGATQNSSNNNLPGSSSAPISSATPSSSSIVNVSSSSVSSAVTSSVSSAVSSVPAHPCASNDQQAFQSMPASIPGRVEAEDFNPNGFMDSSAENEGGDYRDEGVDVKTIDGGYAVGWMTSGEYMEYTINVPSTGEYDVTIRSGAVGGGRALSIEQCGSSLVQNFEVPRISSWGQFKTWSAGKINLQAGKQKIRVSVTGSDYMDLDWIHIGPYDGELDPVTQSCDLPTSFEWEASAPLVSAQNGAFGIKDPSIVKYNDRFHLFATINDGNWKSVYLNFTDWSQADSTRQQAMNGTSGGNTVAPQVFYYRPHGLWYNFTQWPRGYNTTSDISDVNSWTARRDFLTNGPPTEQGKPELDYWNICDDTHCHVFFSRDDGVLYKSKTTRENFPNFNGYEIVMEDHRGNGNSFLFEAANVYKVDGADKYLLLVEAYRTPGYGPRYFRSWTSTSLDGPWDPLAETEENPFAGEANVTWPAGNKWATGISHGEMIRSGYDEYLTIDPCNLEFVFQGDSGESLNGGYGGEPYKLGILRLK